MTELFSATIHVRHELMVEADDPETARAQVLRSVYLRPGEQITKIEITKAPASADRQRWQESEVLRARGNCNQRQRHAAGALPEPELMDLVRSELFRPFGLLERRRKRRDVHAQPYAPSHVVHWEVLENPGLTSEEWCSLLRVHDAVAEVLRHPWISPQGGGAVSVSVREHRGTCLGCTQSHRDHSALVSILWAGRRLSQEYAL